MGLARLHLSPTAPPSSEKRWLKSDKLVAELLAADTIVIGAPSITFACRVAKGAWSISSPASGHPSDTRSRPPEALVKERVIVPRMAFRRRIPAAPRPLQTLATSRQYWALWLTMSPSSPPTRWGLPMPEVHHRPAPMKRRRARQPEPSDARRVDSSRRFAYGPQSPEASCPSVSGAAEIAPTSGVTTPWGHFCVFNAGILFQGTATIRRGPCHV